jgi:hypothetical protein
MGAGHGPMKNMLFMRVLSVVFAASAALAVLAPTAALAAGPTFGQPSATAVLGEPVTIVSTISGAEGSAVDVLIHLVGNPTTIVLAADQISTNTYQAQQEIDISSSAFCSCLAQGNSAPNTHFSFQFRVTASDGTVTLGPVGETTVEDTRFQWQVLEDGLIRLHWYAGDQAFAQSAAAASNDVIAKDAAAMGVTIDQPFDMFIYDTEEAMRTAVSPNRENVQAEAHPDIDTIFAWLPSDQPEDAYNKIVIAHELTHLVFHHAVDNPYGGVPRWLDEGNATYQSEGYSITWQGYVNAAVASNTLIPLDGLAGLFPSVRDEFYLAYGESVAAVDFFIRTYGEPKYWELVKSFATGLSEDDAFTAAIGVDADGFNSAWFNSLGVVPPDPVGPQPGVPGPVPQDWNGGTGEVPATAQPTANPGTTLAPGATAAPLATPGQSARPVSTPGTGSLSGPTDITPTLIVLGVVVLLVIGSVVVAAIVLNNRATRPPPGPPPF